MLERAHRNNEQVSYQLFLYHSQPSAAVGAGTVFLRRILLELGKTGNLRYQVGKPLTAHLPRLPDVTFPMAPPFR